MTPAAVLAKALKSCNRAEIARLTGISMRKVRHAENGAKGHATDADDYLRLCQVLGIDPMTGKAVPPRTPPGTLDRILFAAGVRAIRRYRNKHSIREAAAKMGISITTLSRIENGHVRGIDGMLAACRYIGIHPLHYVGAAGFTGNMTGNLLIAHADQRSAA